MLQFLSFYQKPHETEKFLSKNGVIEAHTQTFRKGGYKFQIFYKDWCKTSENPDFEAKIIGV